MSIIKKRIECNVSLPVDLRRELKYEAVRTDRSCSSVIEQASREYLAKHSFKKQFP